jgi:hypothetical protein
MPDVPTEEPSPFEDVRDGERTTASVRRRQEEGSGGWRRRIPYVAGILASLVTTVIVVLLVMEYTTAKGTLVVEIDQPGAQVYLDGVKWKGEVAGGLKPIEIPIREGNHELRVVKEGFRTHTREIIFRKGQARPIVQVRLKPALKPARPGS